MNWYLIGRGLRLAYLLRIPLIAMFILAVLGPVSYSNVLLGNLLDQGYSHWNLFTVSFSAFLFGFTAVAAMNLILYYGNERFEGSVQLNLAQRHPGLVFLSGVLAALALVVCVYLRTNPNNPANAIPLLLGAIAALALVFAAKVVQLWFTDPDTTPHPPPLLVFPAYRIPALGNFFDWLYHRPPGSFGGVKTGVNQMAQYPLQILQPAGQGYLIHPAPENKTNLRLLSGHVFILSLFAIALLSYLIIGFYKSEIAATDARVPALAFVLLFFIVACWALALLTFFFDRYRFPLLWTLVLLSAITAFAPESDHFFRVEPLKAAPTALTPAEYLKMRLKNTKRLILVASPGGGIQAAAWTGQVLRGLEEQTPAFRNSVALVSSVSGGSLGSMIYAASFAHKIDPADVPKNAARSAIDEVAWGWTGPDFWRALLPWFRIDRTIDRGWALEQKWAAVNNLDTPDHSQSTMLSDWVNLAQNGEMPALIMNAMLVETGAPVVFSNTKFPATPGDNLRINNFYTLYPKSDIRVNTAARLSASFPYVAPASRPNVDAPYGPAYHFVDGGYYDNFGINSLLTWLGEALEDPDVAGNLSDILILQIQHFNPDQVPQPTPAGWGLQLAAPPVALYHMRDFAQASTADNQMRFFAAYYRTRRVNVWKTRIDYDGVKQPDGTDCASPPLSWKLDAGQQACIAKTWTSVLNNQKHSLSCIADYLGTKDPVANCDNPANLLE